MVIPKIVKRWSSFLLLLLPIVYLILSGTFFVNWRPFYRIGPDPVYTYLFNGMTLAGENIEVGYIDNPGIPVQFFSAAVIYIKHLFNYSVPLYHDVLMHTESYLHAICASVSILFVLISWFTGYYTFKRTGNPAIALLFQLTPLVGRYYLTSAAPSPESFMLMFGMPFMAYLYCNCFSNDFRSIGKFSLRYILVYGAFTGFLVSCKYTCFPLLFLVLFLLPTSRSRIQYIGSFILFLLIFISPALPVLGNMIDWLSSLATHTGIYGQGDKGFVNKVEFLANFKILFKEDIYFTSLYILMSISLFIALLKRNQMRPENKIYLRLLSGVWVSSSVLIILVAKHYSFHYLIPVRLCFPLILAGSYGVLKDILKIKIFQNKYILPVLSYLILTFFAYSALKTFLTYPPQPISNITADFLNKYSNVPLIITSDYQSSRIEPSLDFGTAYTGNFRYKYWEFLKKLYPNSYLYNTAKQSQGIIAHWDDIFYTPELFSKYPEIMAYFNDKDSNARKSILTDLSMWRKDTVAHFRLIYSLKESNEYVYEFEGNQNMSRALMANPLEINFDFEKFTVDHSKFVSTDGNHTAEGVNFLSNKEHHSGNNSILLNHQNQYAINYPVRVLPGYLINISIWQKSDDGMGAIAFSSKKYGKFYNLGRAIIDSEATGWKQIEYKCLVPPSIKDSTIIFYLYYYGHGYSYFDDLSIKVYPMKLNTDTFVFKG